MTPNEIKACLAAYQKATTTFDPELVKEALSATFSTDALLHMCYPFGDLKGPEAFYDTCLGPLHEAMPDLERRDLIVMAGTTEEGQYWIGTMGNYMGTFLAPFLDIPPTGHLAHIRYHEFYQIEDNKVVKIQAIWDLPELMMQANAWPMTPQLGKFMCTPGPMGNDGFQISGDGQHNHDKIIDMLTDLCKHPGNPDPTIMNLEKYWHPRFNWYGPAGIGTCRGSSGFRNWHQIPFLHGMPDRATDSKSDRNSEWKIEDSHWVSEGDYVCETGWPNMRLSISGDGWMGIAPAGKDILMRSLDFWRFENGLIRENWVLIDLLDVYKQIGVDVLARLREFNKARNLGAISVPSGMNVQEPRAPAC